MRHIAPLSVLLLLLLGGTQEALSVRVHFVHLGGSSMMKGLFRFDFNVDYVTSPRRHPATDVETNVGFDFVCGPKPYTFLPFRSVTYDPRRRRVYGQVATPAGRTTVFSGDVCRPMSGCWDTGKLRPLMVDQRTVPGGQLGPIAALDGTVYFLYAPASRSFHRQYQVRRLKPGVAFPTHPDDARTLPLEQISVAVQIFSGPWLRAGAALEVLQAADGGVVFVTVFLEFWAPDAGPRREVSVLYTARLGGAYSRFPLLSPSRHGHPRTNLTNHGGIAYSSGKLCWVADDHVMCGNWHPDQALSAPTMVRTLLTVPSAAPVCNATGEARSTSLTGLGLASVTSDRLVLVFACSSEPQWAGSVGVLVTGPTPRLLRVLNWGDTIPATQLFVTPDNLCPDRRALSPAKDFDLEDYATAFRRRGVV